MKALRTLTAVSAMTLAVTAMTMAEAHADATQPEPATDAAEPETTTPLEVRPSRPLATAPVESGTSIWTKLGLCGLVFAGAATFYLRKRAPGAPVGSTIKVAARTSIGVRSEILLVDVDGHRLLLGVTPSSVRTLSVLPVEPSLSEAAEEPRTEAAPAMQTASFGSSFDRLLARAQEEAEIAPVRAPKSSPRDEEPAPYEGQVAVLRRLRPKR
ncbi:MAG: flagellar biosynthetic protein FliO [Polyangiaceae bacterium]|nr:flagellar biosynthetic protein FliO [Polyangiaceae bacterium]